MVTWPPSQAPLASTGPFSYSSRLVFTLHCSGPAAPPSQVCAALAEEARALGCSHSPSRSRGSRGGCSSPGRWRQGGSRKPEKVRRGQAAGTASSLRRADVVVPAPPPEVPHTPAQHCSRVRGPHPASGAEGLAATEHNPPCWHRQKLPPPNSARSHAQPMRPEGLGHSSHSHRGTLSTRRHLPARSRPPSRKAK